MRPVKDRGTWPARTLRRPLDPQRRDVARAGVEHANTGPAARGCRPRTDGLRGSIRRRDRSSRGSANGDAVPNSLPREWQLGPQNTHPKGMNLSHTLIPATIARIRRPETAGRPKRIRHRSHHHLMQGVDGSEALPRERDVSEAWPSSTQGPPQHRSEPTMRRHEEVRRQPRSTGREAPAPTH